MVTVVVAAVEGYQFGLPRAAAETEDLAGVRPVLAIGALPVVPLQLLVLAVPASSVFSSSRTLARRQDLWTPMLVSWPQLAGPL